MKDFKRLLGYLGSYRRDLLLGGFLVIVETAFELVIPVLMADLIDVGVEGRNLDYILQKGVQMGVCRPGSDHGIAVRPLCRPGCLRLGRSNPGCPV